MTNVSRDDKGNLHLPARIIPVPKSISAKAQEALAQPPMRQFKWPSPDDKAAWPRFLKECEASIAPMFELLPPFAGTIGRRTVGSAMVFDLEPTVVPPERRDRAILYLHGGGYVMGGGHQAAQQIQLFAAQIQTAVYASDYRMPPDHPFPAALDDSVDVYRDLLTRYAPGKIAVMGISAGGGLTAATILRLRDLGLPLPGAAVMITPETDLTESGDTFETNQFIDSVLVERISESIQLYADGHDLSDPYLSPLFGDFSNGFPPTLLVSGTRDLFLSNTVRFHRALRKAGIEADLHVFEAMPHGGFFTGAPEDAESVEEQIRFIDSMLGRDTGPLPAVTAPGTIGGNP